MDILYTENACQQMGLMVFFYNRLLLKIRVRRRNT